MALRNNHAPGESIVVPRMNIYVAKNILLFKKEKRKKTRQVAQEVHSVIEKSRLL